MFHKYCMIYKYCQIQCGSLRTSDPTYLLKNGYSPLQGQSPIGPPSGRTLHFILYRALQFIFQFIFNRALQFLSLDSFNSCVSFV